MRPFVLKQSQRPVAPGLSRARHGALQQTHWEVPRADFALPYPDPTMHRKSPDPLPHKPLPRLAGPAPVCCGGAGGLISCLRVWEGLATMLNTMTTGFVNRLRAKDPTAWYELWNVFGPVLQAQLAKWGRGQIGAETVKDLSQETLAALSDSIDRYDPARGARFSTWILAIAKHTLGDEIDRRMALKRGGGKKTAPLDEAWMSKAGGKSPDGKYEAAMFRAKVCAAVRFVERSATFEEFAVFQMRILDGMSGKEVAESLGVSEPTISRRLGKIREQVRAQLAAVMQTYSFTDDELAEAERNGISLTPKNTDDAMFDEAVAEVYRLEMEQRRADELA